MILPPSAYARNRKIDRAHYAEEPIRRWASRKMRAIYLTKPTGCNLKRLKTGIRRHRPCVRRDGPDCRSAVGHLDRRRSRGLRAGSAQSKVGSRQQLRKPQPHNPGLGLSVARLQRCQRPSRRAAVRAFRWRCCFSPSCSICGLGKESIVVPVSTKHASASIARTWSLESAPARPRTSRQDSQSARRH